MASTLMPRLGSWVPIFAMASCLVGATVISDASASDDNQVDIKIQIVEIERRDVQALGIEWKNEIDQAKSINFGLTDEDVLSSLDDDAFQILAEPILTSTDSEPVSFLVGGEVPIVVPGDGDKVEIEYEKIGLSLDVLPTLLSDDRIDLWIRPETSAISSSRPLPNGFQVPTFSVRRADANIELASGQTLAITGVYGPDGVPETGEFPTSGDLPVIGQVFQSSRFQQGETELMILVTPYPA